MEHPAHGAPLRSAPALARSLLDGILQILQVFFDVFSFHILWLIQLQR
jgi:hypothetical protein